MAKTWTKEDALAVIRAAKVVAQGKVIAEADGVGWLIMFPDGQIVGVSSRAKAEAKISRWLKRNLRDNAGGIGVSTVEWRA